MNLKFWKSAEDFSTIYEKLNPGQANLVESQGETFTSSNITPHQRAFETLEIVNRGVNFIVDSAAEIHLDVGDKLNTDVSFNTIRPKRLDTLLNFRSNPYISADVFRRNIYIDLILEGNAFLYFDGEYLYNLPAVDVEIISDKKTFIKEYNYFQTIYTPNEIIHIRDNSSRSIFRGQSRLFSARTSINTLNQIAKYQENFFENNAIPGLVLKTKNVLSEKVKARILAKWIQEYRPRTGGRKPMILDGDFELDPIIDNKEVDFNLTSKSNEEKVLKALGVPPILLDGGNNANITPNLKLFYISTVLPLVNKVTSAFELYFGFDLKPITQDVLALRPELRDLGGYLTSITNAGIITRNEARAEIRYQSNDSPQADELIIPANIAGSAINPTTGGKPAQSNS